MIAAVRYHDFSCGHRVAGHESKCAFLHGHNYRAHFTVVPADDLDALGRVLDFGAIKLRLCAWLEDNWDHRFLLWDQDPLLTLFAGERAQSLMRAAEAEFEGLYSLAETVTQSLVRVPFNPTAENMALHLLHVVGPDRLKGTGARLLKVRIDETRKCSAVAFGGMA